MVHCIEISGLLDGFQDGELEADEMDEVARHLAGCSACERERAQNAALGEQLRAIAIEPDLTGFADAVQQRLAALTPPLHVRVRRYLESAREQVGSALALAAAGLATAALTALMLTPYAYRLVSHRAPAAATIEVASVGTAQAPAVEVVEHEVSPEAAALRDSHPVMPSLASHVSSVAIWNEPAAQTTVAWIPDQP